MTVPAPVIVVNPTSNSNSTNSFISLLNTYSKSNPTQKKPSFAPVSKKQSVHQSTSDPLSVLNHISLPNPQPVVLPSVPSRKRIHPIVPVTSSVQNTTVQSSTQKHFPPKKPSPKLSSPKESLKQSSTKLPSPNKASINHVTVTPAPSSEDLQLRIDTVVSQRSTEMVQQQMTEIDSSTLILATHER